MEDCLPEKITIAPGVEFPVNLVDSFEGYDKSDAVNAVEDAEPMGMTEFQDTGSQIVIRRDLPKVGKHHILFHEMVHLAVEKLKQGNFGIEFLGEAGEPSEDEELFVELLSGALFPMLVSSGLWNGVSREEFMEFYTSLPPEEQI